MPQGPDPPTTSRAVPRGRHGRAVCFGYDSGACEGGANGWQFAKNPDGTDNLSKVVLCGSACQMVQNDPAIQVDVVLGCQKLLVE